MNTAVAERASNSVTEIRHQLDNLGDQFRAALPAHVPVERFSRVVMTAIQNNPDLVTKVDRRSLWNAAMRAAQDGLLPDGREGAIVVYGSQAQWMPMIGGIRKKVRNSGEIATWDVYVVHENDDFDYALGDEPYINHKPTLDAPGRVIAAYSVATLKSGEKSREVMSLAAIEKVRAVSRAKNNGPWVSWYEEMCRKTVARRHAKSLPMSSDLDDLIRRDDELYDFDGAKQEAQQERPRSLAGRLEALARVPATPAADKIPAEAEDVAETEKPVRSADEEADRIGQLIDVATEAVRRGDGDATVMAVAEASKSAERPPKAKAATTTKNPNPGVSASGAASAGGSPPPAAKGEGAAAETGPTVALSPEDVQIAWKLHGDLSACTTADAMTAVTKAMPADLARTKPALWSLLAALTTIHRNRLFGDFDLAEAERRAEHKLHAAAGQPDMLGGGA